MEAAEITVNILTGVVDVNQASDGAAMLSSLAQLAATVTAGVANPSFAVTAASVNAGAMLVTSQKILLDAKYGKAPDMADLASIAGNALVISSLGIAYFNPASNAAKAAYYISRGVGWLGFSLWFENKAHAGELSQVDSNTGSYFTTAQRFIPRRDPLTLDLNGNGIETVPVNVTNPILFDHEGKGIKPGTGWIAPSDGFLVLDRDGNGTIDNGTELFGDNTPLYAADGTVTGTAADGFAALASLLVASFTAWIKPRYQLANYPNWSGRFYGGAF